MNPLVGFSSIRSCTPLNTFRLIHRGTSYLTNPSLLCVVSPKIARLLASDPSASYELPAIPGPIDSFISLLFGEEISINVVNCRFFRYLARDLEIVSLDEAALEIVRQSDTFPRIAAFASDLLELGLSADDEISQLAQTYPTYAELGVKWPLRVLEAVLVSPALDAKDHKGLVQTVVLPMIEADPAKNGGLVKYVDFRKLDDEGRKALFGCPVVDLNLVRGTVIGILLGQKAVSGSRPTQ
jgi:hypothetical protein